MQPLRHSRRHFLRSASAAAGLAASTAWPVVRIGRAEGTSSKNDRPRIGCIGMRYQGTVIADKARAHGDIVAICDVDRNIREQARAAFGSTPAIYEDYRDLLARSDIDVVTIGTPDHWHAKMLIDACRAGKDVYCEKPLTLTVDEGKLIRRVVVGDGPRRASRLVAAERSQFSSGGRDGAAGSHRPVAARRCRARQE